MIPYGKQNISKADISSVVRVLESDYLTQGPVVTNFEEAICNYTGAKHGVAVCNGTAALHVACLALDLGPGDRLWTSPITFLASANCGYYCGAEVDFVDIDPDTCNISVQALKEKLHRARREDLLPKVLVAVHLNGFSCDMEEIHELSLEFGFKIIEDASHAIGGKYHNYPVGSCRFCDITTFSFHPVKTVTTGEGGCAVSNDENLVKRMRLFACHGMTRDIAQMENKSDGPWYYEQIVLGYNYRLTDIHAALGLSQLNRLEEFVARRNEIACIYDESFTGLPLTVPARNPEIYSGMHLYVIRLNLESISRTHQEIFEGLRSQGIGVNLHYIPIHLQPYYRKKGFEIGDFPNAEAYYKRAITLPMYPTISNKELEEVIAKVVEEVR